MKRVVILAAVMGLASCASVMNPVQSTQVYELENAYGIAQAGAVTYVKLPRCQAIVAPPCSNARTVVALGEADKKARIALNALEDFSRSPANYPTLQFGDLFRAAQASVTVFSQLSSSKGA